jgi:hypothetical protein
MASKYKRSEKDFLSFTIKGPIINAKVAPILLEV